VEAEGGELGEVLQPPPGDGVELVVELGREALGEGALQRRPEGAVGDAGFGRRRRLAAESEELVEVPEGAQEALAQVGESLRRDLSLAREVQTADEARDVPEEIEELRQLGLKASCVRRHVPSGW